MISKIVRVSDKGQIAIPVEIRKSMGVERGSDLLLVQAGRRIIIEKPEDAVRESFADLNSPEVMRKLWGGKENDVWDTV